MPATAVYPTIEGGSGTDFLLLTASTGADNLRVSRGSDVRIAQVGNTGMVDANGIEELHLDLGAGADRLEIDPLHGSSVSIVDVDTGQIVTDTGQTQLVTDPDNPNIKTKQPILRFADDGAADVITILGCNAAFAAAISCSLNDTFTITGVNPVNDVITSVRVVHSGDADVFLEHAKRGEGDSLVVNGGDGNDRIDASRLGTLTT